MKNQNQISGKIFKILPLEKGESKNGKEWKKQNINQPYQQQIIIKL